MNYKALRFGTAGSPLSTPRKGRSAGVMHSINLGFTTQELEFVHGVNINDEEAGKIQTLVKKHGFAVTAHGPYYINLNALEKAKQEASKQRIIQTARALQKCGGISATFHPGFYLKMDSEKVYHNVKERLREIMKTLRDESNPVRISPETTGKATQFGSYQELIRLAQDVENLGICIDFSHIHARTNGKYNSKEEFHTILSDVEKGLGREQLNNMHIHLSGINYGEKGEKNHLPLQQSDMRWEALLDTFKQFKLKGSVVCESPLMEADAKLLQEYYYE